MRASVLPWLEARLGKAIVYVAGKDPLEERGGHSTYVRAQARTRTGLMGWRAGVAAITEFVVLSLGCKRPSSSFGYAARSSTTNAGLVAARRLSQSITNRCVRFWRRAMARA